jgi:hypothetical protein
MGQNNYPLPNAALKKLDRLVGTWSINGPVVAGTVTFNWLDGGFFLVQDVDMKYEGRDIKGVEYIGYNESTRICSSHFFDNVGHIFTYDWEIDDNDITIWFGQKGSNNRFKGKFSEDGNSYSGGWEWPGGGYGATLKRINCVIGER